LKLPTVSGIDVIKALSKKNFKIVGRKGSHVRLKKKLNTKTIIVIVPLHPELKKGTLNAILKTANISRKEFIKLLKDPNELVAG